MKLAFMFSVLDDKERDTVIGAMEERKFKKGEWVIRQGEEGDVLYVID
jgi:cAMP-dependent protein kinase regulator